MGRLQLSRQVTAPAKVNLNLRVMGRRDDGYHLIESVMHQVSWGDQLEFTYDSHGPSKTRLVVEGPGVPVGRENLVCRAVEQLRERTGFEGTVEVVLRKRIPMGAGLGGGSADAAVTLTTLNELTGVDLAPGELRELALRLGADVPFAVMGGAALVRGIGEHVTPIPSHLSLPVVLVHPQVQLATQHVFAWWDEKAIPGGPQTDGGLCDPGQGIDVTTALTRRLMTEISNPGRENWRELLINDLEPVVCERVPEVAEALERLRCAPEVVAASMTGSGSTVFALLHPGKSYQRLQNALRGRFEMTLTNFELRGEG